jgi:hypothetical protein
VKLKIAVLLGMACAGLGASYALAGKGGGPGHDAKPQGDASCQHAHVHGTVAAPQTLTVTVVKAGKHSPFAPGQVVTVSLGTTGQTVDVNAEGCATDASTLTAKKAELHARSTSPDQSAGTDGEQNDQGHHQTTTTTTTDTSTDTTTGP